MNFLLDTNVVSEWVKPQPEARVVRWLGQLDEDRAFLSVATLAEIRLGVERLDPGRRRERLTVWLENDLPARFEKRLLDIDGQVAQEWGKLMARAQEGGTPLSAMDGFFAATALSHELILVTRNIRDFERTGVKLFDPWNS